MEAAVGTGRMKKEREERGGLYTWSGICICDRERERSSGDGAKMGKGPDGSDGFDFDSRGEGKEKGKRDEKEQRGDQIGSCVFHSGPRVRIATCQSVTLQELPT